MKKLKFAFWLLLIAFLALLIYENLEFFSATYALKIDLGFYHRDFPPMTHGAIVASFVGIAVLIMLLFYLSSRYETYRAKKTIKSLTHTLDESTEMISSLKLRLEGQLADESQPEEQEAPTAPEEETGEAVAEADVNPAQST